MTCEPINSFAATALSEFKYHDSDGSLVTIEIDIDTPLDSSDEIHRKLIRHLYRRIGYGASWADIENASVTQDDIDNGTQAEKTLGKLVDRLIDNHSNDYQRDDEGNIMEPPSIINGELIYTGNIHYQDTSDNIIYKDIDGNFFNQSDGTPYQGSVNDLTFYADHRRSSIVGGAGHIFESGKFDWVNRDITLRREKDDGDIIGALPPTRQNELISNHWTNESIIGGSNSVRAKLMLFWHGHFAAEEKVPTAGDQSSILRYFKVLFNNAFGNFKTFVEEIGRTPMMLASLNGYLNVCNPGNDGSKTPDENYARELLELFTMGEEYKQLDTYGKPVLDDGKQIMKSNYGDSDVSNLARAFSGWTFDTGSSDSPVEGEFRFQYSFHDWTEKNFIDGTIVGGTPIGDNWENPYPTDSAWVAVFNDGSEPPGQAVAPIGYTFRSNRGRVEGAPLQSGYPYTGTGYPSDNTNLSAEEYKHNQRYYITAGDLEYKAIHKIIFDNRIDEIAYFICRKLYEFYVYGDVEGLNKKLEDTEGLQSDTNLTGLDGFIEALATTFKANWEITPVLKQLFKSQHFYDAGIIGAQIKSPVECGTSIFRLANLKGKWDDANSYEYRYKMTLLRPEANYTFPIIFDDDGEPILDDDGEPILDTDHPNNNGGVINEVTGEGIDTNKSIGSNPLAVHAYRSLQDTDTWVLMYQHWRPTGQQLLDPPDVAGWPGHQSWLNEFTWMKRREMLHYFITKRFFNNRAIDRFVSLAIHLSGFSDINPAQYGYTFVNDVTPSDGVQLVWKMWRHFFTVEPTERQIKDSVASYLEAHTYGDNFPHPIAGSSQSKIRIRELLVYFTEQPEYQLN